MEAREVALKILYDIEKEKAYSNISINKAFANNKLTKLDRSFITELVYGTLENLIFIDYIIEKFSTIKLKKMNIWVLNLIRLGIYQIFFLDKVPDFAVVNESVKLSKIYCKRSSGFINAILRNIIRNKENIQLPKPEKELEKFLSIKYSHPEWMVKRFLKYFTKDFTEELLKSNNETPKLNVRVNTLKTSVENVVNFLKKHGIETSQSPYIPEAIIVKESFKRLEELEIYKKGWIYIQDFSSMLVSRILDPKEGDFIIDVCSAPGGKTTHIAQLMKNKGRILARDVHEHKLTLVKNSANRLGINIIQTEKFDGKELDKSLIETADKVLVDAPCSGLGIIRRKPEIKYRKQPDDIESITRLQILILTNASKYVKKGGELLYSTCTIDPNENQMVVEKFLQKHSNYQLIDINNKYKSMIPGDHKGNMLQLYPHLHGTDGFFIVKLQKK